MKKIPLKLRVPNPTRRSSIDLPNIETCSQCELKDFYETILNKDKTTYKSTNDEPTPIDCVCEMLTKIPDELWGRSNLSILDPCCGNGNFFIPIYFELLKTHDKRSILESILSFNDINEERLENVRKIFRADLYHLNLTNNDFLETTQGLQRYDLIVANPPYAKMTSMGVRTSKSHNLIKALIEKSLSLLKPKGYLLFITPDNWMSYADRNTLIEILTGLQIIYLDIHNAKKYFKKIGSSFTWYVIQNCPSYQDIEVRGLWRGTTYSSHVRSQQRRYIPLLYNDVVQSILSKTVDNPHWEKFPVKISCDLHRYTKRDSISTRPSTSIGTN